MKRVLHSQRGATIILVAVGMLTFFGFLALAIDLGMLYVAHVDAQRAADASALAGASAFMEYDAAQAVTPAHDRAMEYALRNTFRNGPIDSSEVSIRIVPESALVGVRVQRESVPTFFARVLGIRTVPIGAYAAAEAVAAGSAKCLKPFAVPDIWEDANGDVNGNRIWDNGETWAFGDDPGDFYAPYTGPGGAPSETGYGSDFRNGYTPYVGDYGREIKIKVTDPNDISAPEPGIFLPWQIPVDSSQAACEGFGDGGGGASEYRQNICSCNNSNVQLNTPYPIETGNMVGPTWQGTTELIAEDPDAVWDETTHSVRNSKYGADWLNSPRIVKIALFAPGQITKSGMQTIEFNNFALMFIEAQNTLKDPVTGRFIYYVSGNDAPGNTTGSLVKTLKLVK